MIRKAVQQIMLGTVTRNENETRQTLAAIREAGYDALELNGFMIRKTSMMVRMMTKAAGMPAGRGGSYDWPALLREAGLGAVSVHTDLGSVKRDPDAVLRDAERFETPYAVITGMYRFDYTDPEQVKQRAQDLNESGKILRAGGVQLLYHNHNCEFLKLRDSGERAYDLLLRETDPEAVNFEFDSYWPTEAGVDALAVMRRLGTRMKLWHINDRGTRVKPGPVMTPILKSDSMELGYGNMNLTALAEQAKSAGIDAVILESHKNWAEKSPLKSLQLSARFLQEHF